MIYLNEESDKLIVVRNASFFGIDEMYMFISNLNRMGNCPPTTIEFKIQDFESIDKYNYLIYNIKQDHSIITYFSKKWDVFTNLIKCNYFYNWVIRYNYPSYTLVSIYKAEGNEDITNRLKEFANSINMKLLQFYKEDIINVRKQQF